MPGWRFHCDECSIKEFVVLNGVLVFLTMSLFLVNNCTFLLSMSEYEKNMMLLA